METLKRNDKSIETEGYEFMVIDLNKVTPTMAQWLKTNSDIIAYDQSYYYIRMAHEITDPAELARVAQATPFASLSVLIFKTMASSGGINFDTEGYKHYIQLSRSGSVIGVVPVPNFSAVSICYSYPFFQSIIKYYGLTDGSILSFSEVNMGSRTTIVISIVGSGAGPVHFFDFSQNPTMFAPPLKISI
jgi:hypothetical protein